VGEARHPRPRRGCDCRVGLAQNARQRRSAVSAPTVAGIHLVKPTEFLGQTRTPEDEDMTLTRHGTEYVISAGGQTLMSSRMHGSEEALATFACARARTLEAPCCLVGGLGMGFTLRAALDLLPPAATIIVAELVPALIEWNRGPLGPLARHPLRDKRVVISVGDVGAMLRARPNTFDAVLLDVDNGPAAFTASNNADLYGDRGLAAARAALKPGGVFAVWSSREDRRFEQRLRHAGFDVTVERVRGRLKKGGPRHTIFVGTASTRAVSLTGMLPIVGCGA
jgi:spermidine synthase